MVSGLGSDPSEGVPKAGGPCFPSSAIVERIVSSALETPERSGSVPPIGAATGVDGWE